LFEYCQKDHGERQGQSYEGKIKGIFRRPLKLAASKQVSAALAVYEVSELAVVEKYLRIASETDRASLAVIAIISTEFPCYATVLELKKSHPEYV
jgi:hypothetical protein